MQIQGTGLNTRNAYTSDWYGGHGGTNFRLGGSGASDGRHRRQSRQFAARTGADADEVRARLGLEA